MAAATALLSALPACHSCTTAATVCTEQRLCRVLMGLDTPLLGGPARQRAAQRSPKKRPSALLQLHASLRCAITVAAAALAQDV